MQTFKFNLLPKKSKEELEVLKERDNSIFYAVLVVLFSSFIWLTSALILTQVVEPRLQSETQKLDQAKAQLTSLDYVRFKHGERISKLARLKPLLAQRVDTNQIFSVAENLTNLIDGAEISSYGRETGGKFVFNITTDDLSDIAVILQNARTLEDVENVELRSVLHDANSKIFSGIIAMDINESTNGS